MSKVVFGRVFAKNFLSVGNGGIEYDLKKENYTVITAEIGEGKSLLLDAICYSLFNKPFRDINKPQLVNSINSKELLCEIEFSIGAAKYKVVRGMKPNIFEIYYNDELINQDAASKDYQAVLENQILKFNFKSFTQVAILGLANYTAFMSLTTPQRRLIIEELLDIKVFSDMIEILKIDRETNKNQLDKIEQELTVLKEKMKLKKSFIESNKKVNADQLVELENKIKTMLESKLILQDSILPLGEKINSVEADLASGNSIYDKYTKLSVIKTKLESAIKSSEEKINSYKSLNNCPTCEQDICENHKTKLIDNVSVKLTKNNENLIQADSKLKELKTLIDVNDKKRKELSLLIKDYSDKNNELISLDKVINELRLQIENIKNINSDQVLKAQLELNKEAMSATAVVEEKKKLIEERSLYESSLPLLKDQGIKASIIRKIIPLFNSLINKFLNDMDFFVSFEFDEHFNEVIKSRYRDTFSYNSFSQGQKLKIDLAILFAWRELIRQRSAIDTNLLIFDEILDSSISTNGIYLLLDILYSDIMHETNVFIISHRQEWTEKFSNVIELEMKNNFTVIKEKD